MTETNNDQHIGSLVSEYVLDLMPIEERSSHTRHIAHCSECRKLVAAERRIGALVSSTVSATGQNQTQLKTLMPSLPKKRTGFFSKASIYQQIAFASVFLILFFAGINFVFNQNVTGFASPQSTVYITTASLTGTPTIATSSPTPLIETFEADFVPPIG